MRPSWVDPRAEYGIEAVAPGALVGKQSIIIFPELLTMAEPTRIDSQTYISVALDMGPMTVVCPGAKVIGGAARKVTLKRWSFIGWNSLVMARSEKYDGLIGVGFGAPGPAIEGDVVFEQFSGLASMSSCHPGVTFPEGAVVGMHSMVHKSSDLIPWFLHKGVPAKPWRKRDRERVLREAEQVEGTVKAPMHICGPKCGHRCGIL